MLKKILNKYNLKNIPFNILFAGLFVIVSLILLRSEDKRMNQRVLGLQTQVKADQELAYKWEQILTERPDYRDGWIQIAAIYYQLGEEEKAREAINKAKTIDPNNQTILTFEKMIQ